MDSSAVFKLPYQCYQNILRNHILHVHGQCLFALHTRELYIAIVSADPNKRKPIQIIWLVDWIPGVCG